jgi:chromosomal replication initiation ATPase DnaA
MAEDARQLPLDLPAPPRYGREDFLRAPCNDAALTLIERWPAWPAPSLLLAGPPGAGKSHLSAIWARRAGALEIRPEALPSVAALAEAAPLALALDGLERVCDETALFHLLNFATERGVSLLMTARRLARAEDVRLPDLLSRLRRAPVMEIGAPDDDLMRAVLEKLFRDRQLVVDNGVLDYAALRLERSLEAARAFVEALDRESLAQGRRATRVLAGEVLRRFTEP